MYITIIMSINKKIKLIPVNTITTRLGPPNCRIMTILPNPKKIISPWNLELDSHKKNIEINPELDLLKNIEINPELDLLKNKILK